MKVTSEMVAAAKKAIAQIPASGGYALALYPETLRDKLSDHLLEVVAKTALEAVLTEPPGPRPGLE